jgi:membrane-bound ClpP family serine protease
LQELNNKQEQTMTIRSARRLRYTGAVLMVVGAVLLLGSTALTADANIGAIGLVSFVMFVIGAAIVANFAD